ncbi:MAG: STAS domain-containing protein [Rhodoferax sp.]|nr:MAG: STAS domain-containing protein [Rhodoferax sp.]
MEFVNTVSALPAEPTPARRPPAGLAGDLWGGLAAMLVALPSSIAFGVTIFAGLGPSYAAQGAVAGIVGATALGLLATALGGSQKLISAPCAPAAAVLSALAITYSGNGYAPEQVLLLLSLIALLAGAIQITLGSLHIGRLIKYIPYPVVSGYLSAVGLIIIGSQIPKFLGVSTGDGLWASLGNPHLWAWQGMVVGALVAASMWLVPRLTQRVPATIVAVVVGVGTYLLLALFDADLLRTQGNPLLVGELPSGGFHPLDMLSQRWDAARALDAPVVLGLLVPALTLAVLLSIDTLKTCVVLDAMTQTSHNSDRELIGQGIGNAVAAVLGGVSGAGTMGASLVNISSGGETRRAGLVAALLSLVAFVALGPLLAWIPVSALAGILIVVGLRMIDRHSLQFFFTPATRLDFAVIVAVILVALFVNLIAASGVGVALAILLFIREQTRSSVVRNRIEGQEIVSKWARNHSDLAVQPNDLNSMVVFELQGSLFFGTANQLHAALEPETGRRKYVILSMRRVQSLDVTATHVLEQIKDQLEANNAYLVFCDIPKDLPSGLKMKRFLKETGVVRPTNKAFAFRQLDEALEWVEAQSRLQAQEQPPLQLADFPMLQGQSEESLRALESLGHQHTVKAGKKLFKGEVSPQDLILVRSGALKITLPLRSKGSYHLSTVGPGGVVAGTAELLDGGQTVDAQAVVDTEVFRLAPEDLATIRSQHPALALALVESVLHALSSHLRITVSEVQALRS